MARSRKTMDEKDERLVQYIFDHPEMSETACIMACGWKEGSVTKVLKRVRAVIDARKAERQAITKKQEAAAITKSSLSLQGISQRCAAIIDDGPDNFGRYDSQIAAMKLGLVILGVDLPSETEIKQGIVKHPNGGVEVYQSKWIRQAGEERSLSGATETTNVGISGSS